MSEQRLMKLQEPFDDKYRTQKSGLGPLGQFPDAVYEQRLDDVFGFNWGCERQGGGYKITVRTISPTRKIVREGESFKEACMKFGVGRYLLLEEQNQE